MSFVARPTSLPEVVILEPEVFADERGFFLESFNAKKFEEMTGLRREFVQDNHSHSARNVLRGLHYQLGRPQGKLVRVVAGKVFDVAVDVRRSSPNFGKWVGVELSAGNKRQLWIPEGFAHGFLVMSDEADLLYKTTEYRIPALERAIVWDDADLAIGWPLQGGVVMSARDRAASGLLRAETFQ